MVLMWCKTCLWRAVTRVLASRCTLRFGMRNCSQTWYRALLRDFHLKMATTLSAFFNSACAAGNGSSTALLRVYLLAKKSGSVFLVGIFLDFVRVTTRTMHPHGAYVRRAKRNRIDRHRGGI